LAGDCSANGNALPDQLRASIISISLWVGRYSSEVMQRNADIEPLIDVNRSVMQGLAGQIEAEATAMASVA
jgi:flagellar protein FlaF